MARLFVEVWKEWGVDEESTYKGVAATWMMVPKDAVNLVLLKDKDVTLGYDTSRLQVMEHSGGDLDRARTFDPRDKSLLESVSLLSLLQGTQDREDVVSDRRVPGAPP